MQAGINPEGGSGHVATRPLGVLTELFGLHSGHGSPSINARQEGVLFDTSNVFGLKHILLPSTSQKGLYPCALSGHSATEF